MASTHELDQLLDELRLTSVGIPNSQGTPRRNRFDHDRYVQTYRGPNTSQYYGSSTFESRYPARSSSTSGQNYQRKCETGHGRWKSSHTENVYSRERRFCDNISGFDQGNNYSLLTFTQKDNLQKVADNILPSSRNPSTFKTSLTHVTPTPQKRFSQINITIDPEIGITNTSSRVNNRYQYSPRYNISSETAIESTTTMREKILEEELRKTREELAYLKRSNSVIDESFYDQPTIPIKRDYNFEKLSRQQRQETSQDRKQDQYMSQHDVRQSFSSYRPSMQTNMPDMNSPFTLPKRAMSSANVQNCQSWNIKDGSNSEMNSPIGYRSTTRTRPFVGGYSARRERLRSEAAEEASRRKYNQTFENQSSSNILADSSNNLQRQHMQSESRRQHYHSMSTIQPERRGFEETESVTLQPIGRGVHNLDSRLGSTVTLSKLNRGGTSSMMDGLNQVDSYSGRRLAPQQKTTTSFGRQNSAYDVSCENIRNISSSSAFLAPRRVSGSVKSENQSQSIAATEAMKNVIYHDFNTTNRAQATKIARVQETAAVWYRLKISRQEAITLLKHQPPGSFVIRDSTTYKDAFGLAVKVAKVSKKSNFSKFMKNILHDSDSDLVRHYLIETVNAPARGVRIKGFSMEPVFPSLVSLIYEHTLVQLALPCCLVLPPLPFNSLAPYFADTSLISMVNGDSDSATIVHDDLSNVHSRRMLDTSSNHQEGSILNSKIVTKPVTVRTANTPLSPTAGLFTSEFNVSRPTFSCRCLYLGFKDINYSTGETGLILAVNALIPSNVLLADTCDISQSETALQYTECVLQVSRCDGILLTDLARKVFFQRQFSTSSFMYAGVDNSGKMFIHPNHSRMGYESPRLFGIIISRLSGGNVCHLFSEFDENETAPTIVSQINSILGDVRNPE